MDFQVRSAFPRVFVVPAAVYDVRVLSISDLRGGGERGGGGDGGEEGSGEREES